MATEPNLRDLFGAMPDSARPIDTDAVIRRSRMRRLPRQLGIGGVTTLAIAGIGAVGVQALSHTTSSSSDSAGSAATSEQAPVPLSAPEGAADGGPTSKRAPADRINLCGGTVAEVAPSQTGLVLTVDFPASPVGTASVTGTVTLSNTGTGTVTGYTSAVPAITLAQGGIVLWHSNGPVIQSITDVALAPGDSLEFTASFSPVTCTVDDDTAEAFRADLPPVAAGDYQVSAAADVVIGNNAELVTGPAQTVRIG